jgi:fructose-1,6-bisphosphatase/inositol monophosphatase family enzyme
MQPTTDFYVSAQACIEKVVREYRPTILEAHGNIDPSIKPDATPVTVFDEQLEQMLRDALTSFDSSIGFEGEELGKSGNEETFWLIDPIDGTESFVRGLPFVRNIVTLIDNNEPVFTLIYRPIADELLIATKGGGAFNNGRPIHVSNRPMERAWLDLSIPLLDNSAISLVQSIRPYINGFRTIGEFTYVAQGQLDGQLLYKAGGGPWDYAPRALLAREAGGRVANVGADTYDFRNNDTLMANPVIFDDLMKIITESIAATS